MCLPEREITREDYEGVDRVYMVHFSSGDFSEASLGHFRQMLVFRRLNALRQWGLSVVGGISPLYDFGNVKGKRVVVGGRNFTDKDDPQCVMQLAGRLIEAGATEVIIDEALCMRQEYE